MTCPECAGTGALIASHVRVANGPDRFNVPHTCPRCNGTRKVSDEMLAWMERGRACRIKRIDAGYTLRQFSQEIGWKASDLCAAEFGRVDPSPLEELWRCRLSP